MKVLSLLIACLLLAGCGTQKPKAEGIWQQGFEKKTKASELARTAMSVRHIVKGDTVLIECYSPNRHFASSKTEKNHGELSIDVFVDGQKRLSNIITAAFTVGHLEKGIHQIKLVFSSKGEKNAPVPAEFDVAIFPSR
ncbi:hypothetical protein LRR81_06705 [Metabacillus sp. GX 13764]|uniref:hypothetical protein n=1 Tax=Metabacillus kandeliae TaxID=2900151 RepID=UPI001E58102B|nr:hypothetical protein [Metabacillus kandeliae]MCD7033921.1 hypothetical protein [Metabacillus kandeliae]